MVAEILDSVPPRRGGRTPRIIAEAHTDTDDVSLPVRGDYSDMEHVCATVKTHWEAGAQRRRWEVAETMGFETDEF